MSTQRQDKAFAELMEEAVDPVKIAESALQSAIDYISSEFEPDDIFTTKQLDEWATSNGYIKE